LTAWSLIGAAIDTPDVDWVALAPTLAMLSAAAVALLGSVIVPAAWRKPLAAAAVAAGFATAFGLAVWVFSESEEAQYVIADTLARDRLAAFAQMVIAGAGLLAVGVSWGERFAEEHAGEYYALLATAAAGMAFFVQSGNLMLLFLALEWFSISLYVMCAIAGDRPQSLEAGLKYLIVGSFGSAVLLFGSALIYGTTGELGFREIAQATAEQDLTSDPLLLAGLAMLLTGLGFKASAAPFHMWTPDVYEGAPSPVTAFMSAATKTAAFVLILRVLVTAFPELDEFWTVAVAVLAVASLAIGNLAALVQRNVKRMLAYSSIAHAGFLLIPVAANNGIGDRALLFYLVPYTAMSIGAFAVLAARERELGGRPVTIEQLWGFGWERPLLGVAMWVFMLGFAGLPMTGGFFAKFYAFAAAVEAGWTWLVIVGVVATAVSLYYYLGIIRALYMRSSAELRLAPAGGSPPRDRILEGTVAACLTVTVATFIAVQPVIDWARDAAAALPFGP
jgi:NADH-quinone oxidoreductase subunit N